MRGSANNKKETMRLWRENGCWSNDAGITSSLLSLLLPLCLLSLSCSPSVFFSSLLHISVFLLSGAHLSSHFIISHAAETRPSQESLQDNFFFHPFSFSWTKTAEEVFSGSHPRVNQRNLSTKTPLKEPQRDTKSTFERCKTPNPDAKLPPRDTKTTRDVQPTAELSKEMEKESE